VAGRSIFYAGSVTRPHDDIDLAVWPEDLPRIARLLEADGWRHAPSEDEDGGTGYERSGVRLELTFLVRDDDGSIFIPMSHGRVPWSKEGFADDVRELHGVRSRVITSRSSWAGSRHLATIRKMQPRTAQTFTVLSAIL
jgi:hypothetical protein